VDPHSTEPDESGDVIDHATADRLDGRVCVIAGAAGAMAESSARRLTSEGAVVVGVDRLEHSVGTLSLQEPDVEDGMNRRPGR